MTDDELRFLVTSSLPRAERQLRKLGRKLVDMLCRECGYPQGSLSEASIFPLITIGRLGEGVRQNAVAEEIGVEGPALVRLLDLLAEQKLIERQEDPGDRRAKMLWLTDEGRKLRLRIETHLTKIRAEVLRAHSRDDLIAALRVIRTMSTFVDDGVLDEMFADNAT